MTPPSIDTGNKKSNSLDKDTPANITVQRDNDEKLRDRQLRSSTLKSEILSRSTRESPGIGTVDSLRTDLPNFVGHVASIDQVEENAPDGRSVGKGGRVEHSRRLVHVGRVGHSRSNYLRTKYIGGVLGNLGVVGRSKRGGPGGVRD